MDNALFMLLKVLPSTISHLSFVGVFFSSEFSFGALLCVWVCVRKYNTLRNAAGIEVCVCVCVVLTLLTTEM